MNANAGLIKQGQLELSGADEIKTLLRAGNFTRGLESGHCAGPGSHDGSCNQHIRTPGLKLDPAYGGTLRHAVRQEAVAMAMVALESSASGLSAQHVAGRDREQPGQPQHRRRGRTNFQDLLYLHKAQPGLRRRLGRPDTLGIQIGGLACGFPALSLISRRVRATGRPSM